MMEVKHIDLLKEGTLLPPRGDVCQVCAIKHDPLMPHNHLSIYYQMAFRKVHDRWPTLEDAMSHCTEEMKAHWLQAMAGVEGDKI